MDKGTKYLIKLFTISIVLMFIVGSILTTQQPTTDFFLSMIVVHLILKHTDSLETPS